MVRTKSIVSLSDVKRHLEEDRDFLKELLREVIEETLEQQMDETLGAQKGERTSARIGYRSGYYSRTLITRVGKLELRIPQDRQGHFSPQLFERYQRSEKALVSALAEMYIQGVSTRKVKAVTEELCGHAFSASSISSIVKTLDDQLELFAHRRLEEAYPYLIVDARYEKVRESGSIRSQAVLIAIGIDWDGRRQVLGVEMANRESASSWKEFLLTLKQRGLKGVELVVSDDHAGLKNLPAFGGKRRGFVGFKPNAMPQAVGEMPGRSLFFQEIAGREVYVRAFFARLYRFNRQALGLFNLLQGLNEFRRGPASNPEGAGLVGIVVVQPRAHVHQNRAFFKNPVQARNGVGQGSVWAHRHNGAERVFACSVIAEEFFYAPGYFCFRSSGNKQGRHMLHQFVV